MLGFVTIQDHAPGAGDRLLTATAERLAAAGLRLAGAVQINTEISPGCECDMDLRILGDDGPLVRITQSLGAGSQACRLDSEALTRAVARTESVLDRGAELLIVNKFGKQECFGRGFRDTIARALAAGIPVLVHVPDEQLPGFRDFAGDLAEHVAAERIEDWCRTQLARPAA
ncbi:DUF2478 domain-containing protein [Paracoccus sp. PS-1]|uniref:DUF2478 domain-containing protein n=1 Tax=unclassified Paracoccus (in: a-proteobacteria) TaxID=2688777 RepID=UPI00048FE902|nr:MULTISPECIES: DUF2478 domain-containing protein [unclassified Paracoccus (in: a-proteobacteria)]MDQ7260229.1 DUF2478 domain-containing protein [Paracoccus sp. PS1]